jgi:serine/threonine protein kinase
MSASSDARSPVELLADEFLARCKRGEKPTIKEYCDRHPDLADEIRDVFEAMLMVEDLKPGPDDTSDSSAVSVQVESQRLEQVGGYRILCEIGRGGMGVVYRARDTALDRDVAVKLLSERYPADSPAAQRFLSEARITGQLQHPGIRTVHQVGTLANGRPFLAMKLIKGRRSDRRGARARAMQSKHNLRMRSCPSRRRRGG